MARKLTLIRETRSTTPEGKTRRGVELYERLADESLELIRKMDGLDAGCDEMIEDLARIEQSFDLAIPPARRALIVIDGGKTASPRGER